ncbi:GrpB family protein [Clostridium sp. OS1-26]|uniref:GrpB family protein n=1 Tax=Clostridium sp. OS1-26 TaxID=3070681 RepID=UPI0027DECF9A|nr:GrpB family protein [Clostridium sp. OS1-26]WML34395.1 GrpB family protein [Clostridium sp. OS1-26]
MIEFVNTRHRIWSGIHFGSTAIRGMSTKPIIDIMIIVEDINKIDEYNDNMSKHKYCIRGESGIEERRYFVKLTADNSGNHTHHILSTYKKEGATYLNISFSPKRYIGGEEPGKFIEDKLPDMFAVACELYGDGIDPKEFEGFWNFYESKKGLIWRKVVGDNIIYVKLGKNPTMNFTTVTSASVSILKKAGLIFQV